MSNISNRHQVTPFIAGTSAPLSGQRLAKIGYKQTSEMTKKGEIAPASVCASVPMIPATEIEARIDRLMPYVRGMLENAQDGIVRSLYDSDRGLSAVSDDDISVDACISFLQAEAAGDRLKKETILAWFDSEVSENLTVLVAEKLGFSDLNADTMVTVDKHVRIYRDLIGMLAGGKTILEAKQIRGCEVAIGLAATADRISEKLTDRLNAMKAPKKMIELLDL